LEEAAKRLGLSFEFFDTHRNLVRVGTKPPLLFSGTITPFNSEMTAKICRDKEYAYFLLRNKIAMPHSRGFLDPGCDEEYSHYLQFHSVDVIVTEILREFSLPVIIKKNAGARGRNVFLAKEKDEVAAALQKIFNRDSADYDYIALAQEYLNISHEYRVVVHSGEVLLAYEKDKTGAKFNGNLSPLHWEDAKAVPVDDLKSLERFRTFAAPIYENIDLRFGGLDIAEDAEGRLHLLELNTKPGFSIFIRDNGPERVVGMYEKVLSEADSGHA
jgi:glutathione synthase/RimK-type ligase-like ATP-grasp enzyme